MPETVYVTSPDDVEAKAVLRRYHHGPALGPADWLSRGAFLAAIIASLIYTLASDHGSAGVLFMAVALIALIVMVILRQPKAERDLNKMVKSGRIAKLDPALIALWDGMREEAGITLDAFRREQALAGLYHLNRSLHQRLIQYRHSDGLSRRNHVVHIRVALRPHIERLRHQR